MKCKSCGAELADDAKFCRSCGAPVSSDVSEGSSCGMGEEKAPDAQEAVADADAVESAGESGQVQASMLNFVKGVPAKSKKLVIGVAAGVVAVLVAVVAFVMVSGNVPEDIVKQDLMKSDLVQNGAVSSDFVNDSSYKVTEFKVTKQADENASAAEAQFVKAMMGADKLRKVEVSGKIANDNFETSFQGHAYYVKSGNDWMSLGFAADSKDTKPLKGVDTVVSGSSYSGSSDSNVSYSDFSATLDESNGSYSSTATQTVKYSYWFADDTATSTTTFTFDQEKGWQRQGNAELSGMATEWKLGGKTFSTTFDGGSGKVTETIAFAEPSGDDCECTYVAKYDPSSEGDSYTTYNAINLSGNASGKFQHDFSKDAFQIELNDAANSVTYSVSGNSYSSKVSAGQGTVNTVSANMKTKSIYRDSKLWGESIFETTGKTLTEVTNA